MVDANKLLNRKGMGKVFKEADEANKPKLNVKRLCSRRDKAKSNLDQWRSLLETAYHYAMPDYNPFENYGRGGLNTPGQQYDSDIYDLTLPIAHQRLADKMLMGMVPQGSQWVKFKPGSFFGEPDSPLYQKALVETQKMTTEFFRVVDNSNFYLATGESLDDVLVSTGVLAINEGTKENPLLCEAVPASHVMIEGNAQGGIEALFRDWYDVSYDYIKVLWPDADLSSLGNHDPDDKITFWEMAYIDREAKGKGKKKYKYVVMTDAKEVVLEQSHPSWPWIVYRMRKMAGEVRGRGPTLRAWPTSATINKAVEDELISAAFTANPMWMSASDSAFNPDTFEPHPGNVIPVQMVMGQWPITPLQASGNIQFNALLVNDFRQQINDMLYAFPLGGVNGPQQTATESQIRFNENLESFSAMVPRLQNEFFVPTVKRIMWVINKVLPETFAGIDPEIKEKLISVDGELLHLEFETPLMTAKGQIKTQNILNFYQSVASILGPEAASAALNPPNVITAIAENQDVEMTNVRSKEELEQLTQAAGQVAAQQIQDQGLAADESSES